MIDISIHRKHNKFPRDSIRIENVEYLVETDGIFTGISTITELTLAEHLISEYKAKGEIFVKDLRGSFLIHLFDKKRRKHLIYTNHVGDKRIYYFHQQDKSIVSNSIGYIAGELQKNNISLTLDRNAAYYMLTYGHMFGDKTPISEVKRLLPGHYIRIADQKLETTSYHKLSNKPDEHLSENKCVERVDELFRNAVAREFEKDADYGLDSICALSGGLDSRMVTWVGHELGYSMTNFTFGRQHSSDLSIAEQIAKKLDHPWICKTLDHATFMLDVDQVTQLSEGISTYLPISHGKYATDAVDFSSYGLLHSGQLGDVILGSYARGEDHVKPGFIWSISSRLIHKLPKSDLEDFENMELLLMYNRGFNFILSGNLPVQQYSEVTAPFLDVDFLEFSLSIPLKFRDNHRIYKKWILEKYRGAAAFKWENLGRKITEKTISVRGKDIPVSALPSFIKKGVRYHLQKSGKTITSKNQGMNPFQYWYDTNREVHQYIEQYFKENIDIIADKEIQNDCELLFTKGTIHEKALVLTLISSVKQFWS